MKTNQTIATKRCADRKSESLFVTVIKGLTVSVVPNPKHDFLMTTREVAIGYGVKPSSIRSHKVRYASDFIEGKHYVTSSFPTSVANCNSRNCTNNLTTNLIYWTKRGIVRLGFFIKSPQARLFRDWAEDLVIAKMEDRNDTDIAQKLKAYCDNYSKSAKCIIEECQQKFGVGMGLCNIPHSLTYHADWSLLKNLEYLMPRIHWGLADGIYAMHQSIKFEKQLQETRCTLGGIADTLYHKHRILPEQW